MFNRKTSLPFWISRCNTSLFSVAGPSVQMILVLRIELRIEFRNAKAKTLLRGVSAPQQLRPKPNLQFCDSKKEARFSKRAASRNQCVSLFQFALSLFGQLKMFLDYLGRVLCKRFHIWIRPTLCLLLKFGQVLFVILDHRIHVGFVRAPLSSRLLAG